jgi:hypothetical protein
LPKLNKIEYEKRKESLHISEKECFEKEKTLKEKDFLVRGVEKWYC